MLHVLWDFTTCVYISISDDTCAPYISESCSTCADATYTNRHCMGVSDVCNLHKNVQLFYVPACDNWMNQFHSHTLRAS